MSILDKLYPGSFRGIPFLIKSSSIKGGRKTVTHEFPNSDRRYVEDLGLMNETINLQCNIRSDYYFSNRDAIKDALEQQGYGTLIHPFYGIRNVAVTSYSIGEDTSSLGDVSLSLELAVGQELLYPGSQASGQTISQLVDGLFTAMKSTFYSSYEWIAVYGSNITQIGNAVRDIYELVDSVADTYITRSNFSDENVADYRAVYTDYTSNYIPYLQASGTASTGTIYDSTRDLIEGLEFVGNTPNEAFDIGIKLANFTLSKPLLTATTAQGVSRNKNINSLQDMVLVFAFGVTCRNAASYAFKSTEDLDYIRSKVDGQYEVLLDRTTLSSEVFQRVQDIRANLMDLLDKLKVTAPSIHVVDGKELPLTVLEYMYYGDLPIYGISEVDLSIQSRTEDLRLLNKAINVDPTRNTGNFKLYIEED